MSERTIFMAALDIDDPAERWAYLDESCLGNAELRNRVEALIHSHEQSASFLNSPPPGIESSHVRPVTEVSGDVIGPYSLLKQIGEGGFGAVFLAEQERPIKRRVALKVIKPGMDTRQVIARFEAERQALAMMEHPNIAKVHDAGATENGRPYFVMELVQGIPITEYCDQCNLTTRERLELFVTVCQAVQHAHQKGVIHRDIKPTNVLVAMQDGRPTPKIIDFIKEGLSEYFIYTIEGTETIPNGWSKRVRSFEATDVPLKIQYRYRPKEYGDQLVRMYLMTNDEKSKLGTTPLPDGVVRVFRDNGRDGLSYLTQQSIKYIPIGDKIELNLGSDPEVVFELIKLRTFREAIWMQINGTSRYQQVGGDAVQSEANSSVAGWDDHTIYSQRIRNYTAKPIDVEIRRSFEGHVIFRSQLEPKLHDYQTVAFSTQVAAGAKEDLPFEIVQQQGYNAKQNNVTLENADAKP